MVSSPSNPGQPETPDHLTPSPSKASELSGIHTEQMFRLIDSILPFEACLYYQFLPLALEGRHLKLGMVVPQDTTALDYVRHILAYLNCSLKTELITPETHQSLLSAYLNYTHTSSSPRKQGSKDKYKVVQCEKPTLILNDSQASEGEASEPSVDTPNPTMSQPLKGESPQSPTTAAQTPVFESNVSITAEPTTAVAPISRVAPSTEALPILEVQALHLYRPIEFIATLPPPQLLQELLGRVLIDGIGRLYFERQPEQCRILWSQDGVLQSVLENVPLPVFQGVIIELKRLVNLPLLPVIQPKQVEIERRHQQEALLLRLRVMPGTYGEEATLQVLRGVALKFYQRQQMDKLSEDALKLAQQLQQKLSELRDRSYHNSMPLEALPALNQLLQGLDKQLQSLTELQINQHSDNSAS